MVTFLLRGQSWRKILSVCIIRSCILCSLILCCAVGRLPAQTPRFVSDDTLATVGPTVITERELVERLELMPWPGKERRDQHDSMKVKALLSLVAEHLLAARATELGLNADSAHRRRVENLEHMLVRDELYLREVRGKVKVSSAEITQAMRRFTRIVSTVMFLTKSQEDARAVQQRLASPTRLDSNLLSSLVPHVVYSDTLQIKMGSVEGPVEDAGFALDDAHRVSPPVKTGRAGWAVFYYVGSGTNPDAARLSLPDRRTRVVNLLKARKEKERLNAFSGSVLAQKHAEARGEIFDMFADSARSLILQDSVRYQHKGGYFLSGVLLDSLRRRLAAHLDDVFVEIAEGNITLDQILASLGNDELAFSSLDEADFRSRLNGAVRRLVEEEFMTREGLRRNLGQAPNVRRDMGVWDRYWLARVLEKELRDSMRVSEDEVMDYLVRHAGQTSGTWEVNIREVLSDSLVTALRTLERILHGEPMQDVAMQFSRRLPWAERGGESDYFRIRDHPTLGFAALSAQPGSLVGPLRVPEGYSVFTLLGIRRDPRDSLTLSIDSLRTVVKQVLTSEKSQAEFNRVIVRLARNLPITIRYGRLSNVKIIPSNMVTRRYLGFGGVMNATPILMPQWEWVKDLPERRDLLP
jgi:hypothetical protein